MTYRKTSVLLLLFILGTTTTLSAQSTIEKKHNTENRNKEKDSIEVEKNLGKVLPALKIETPEGIVLTEKDFKTKGHLFLITINPTCGHCNNMGALINRNAALFKDSKVVFMMTPRNALNLDFFTNSSHIGEHPELIVGIDQNNTIKKLNDGGTMPYINIYKNGKLVKKMNGDVALEEFKKYLP